MEPRRLSIAEKIAATGEFVASEIKQQVRKLPGFHNLTRVFGMTDEEIQEDLKRLRKERFYEDLKQAGYGGEIPRGAKTPERHERGGLFRELGRSAIRRER